MNQFVQFGFQIPVFDVPVSIGWGTLILAAIITLDAVEYIKKQYPASSFGYALAGTIAMFLTMLSVAVHEMCHALMAYAFDVRITGAGFMALGAYVEHGKLDGLPWFVGFMISLAGPFSNLALAVIAAIVVRFFGESLGENTVQYVSHINWRLFKLNLLPIFVLDGGHAAYYLFQAFFSQGVALAISTGLTALTIFIWWDVAKERREKRRRMSLREKIEAEEDAFDEMLETL